MGLLLPRLQVEPAARGALRSFGLAVVGVVRDQLRQGLGDSLAPVFALADQPCLELSALAEIQPGQKLAAIQIDRGLQALGLGFFPRG